MAGIFAGDDEAVAIYAGDEPAVAVYVGSELVWPTGQQPWQEILAEATAASATLLYDPDNPNTRTTRADGGDTFVESISDAMENGPDYEQTTAANQPELVTLNGRKVMLCTGTRRLVSASTLSGIFGSTATVMLWVRETNAGAVRGIWDSGGAHAFWTESSSFFLWNGSIRTLGPRDSDGHLFTACFTGSVETRYYRMDGSHVGSSTLGTTSPSGLSPWGESFGDYWLGELGPLVIWDGAIAAPTDLEDKIIEHYPVGS